MARTEQVRYAFNRGLISRLALARVDLKRPALSAEVQTNWMPRTLGSMMLRAGLRYLCHTSFDAAVRMIDFVRSLTATYIVEFSTGAFRVLANDTPIQRTARTAAIVNPNFTTDILNWTDSSEVGGAVAWVAATVGGYAGLTGNGTAAGILEQTVVVAAGDIGKEHYIRIDIARGPVTVRIGSAAGLDDYFAQANLGTGIHSLAFTPTGAAFTIRFQNRLKRQVLVDDAFMEATGDMRFASPFVGADDLDNIRAGIDSQSVDVLFIACNGRQPRRLERRTNGSSWSIVLYAPEDGPFKAPNSSTQTMAPAALSGNTTLTSSLPYFDATRVGQLFRLAQNGQSGQKNMTLLNDATGSIHVTGSGTFRSIAIYLVGMTVGRTVVLEYSADNTTWTPVPLKSWTADTNEGYTDGLDNQSIYYRLRCSVVGAAGGTLATVSIATGTQIGTCRITSIASTTVANVEVLADFGSTTATTDWEEGLWCDKNGWPSAVALYEGRLTWAGFDQIEGSVSDAFDSFEENTVGDSGPINRTIGSGPMDTINWILPMQRLLLGAQMSEHSVRSNAFDEPLTPANFNRKGCGTQGSANVQAAKIDSRGVFVGRSQTRLYELAFQSETYDYGTTDLTVLNPDVLKPMVKRLAVQRKPDTRIHLVLSDGSVAVLVYDHAEQVNCFVKITTNGTIEDACVLPAIAGNDEDQVYYSVARVVNGATVRFIEKWALESDCIGASLNKQADAFVICGGGSSHLTGLGHLIGQTVVCWANAKDLGTYVVAADGSIDVTENVGPDGAVVGLGYTALFQSAKLGQTLSHQKTIDHFAPVLANTHAQGLWYGADFTHMDNLPLMYRGAAVDPNRVYTEYDEQQQEFPGTWDADARLCLKGMAPRPVTVLATVIDGQVTSG